MANVCCATDSVEYPAALRHSIPRRARYSLSRLFVPVALTQTSFRFRADATSGFADRNFVYYDHIRVFNALRNFFRGSARVFYGYAELFKFGKINIAAE